MLARRLRAIEADVDELSDLVAKEVEGDETYRCLLTVPGVGRSTAAQLVAAVQVGAFKSLLIFTCLSLVRSDNEFGRYYRACRSRGMRHTAALKATARKRLKVIYAVMRDVRPYEPR